MRLLIIEDEHRLAHSMKLGFEAEGYAVDVRHDGQAGYQVATDGTGEYALIVLDDTLTPISGSAIVRKLRTRGNHVPIILLTEDQDRRALNGGNTGADDYLAKPFSFDALLSRVRVLLRGSNRAFSETLMIGDLLLDPADKRVERAGQFIRLTSKEFAILEYLMRHPGRVLSKDNIISHVWNFDAAVPPNNVEVFITFLRAKIDKPFKKPLLRTIRGFGYTLSTDS